LAGADNTKKVYINNTATLSADAAVYALRVEGGGGLTNTARLSIGDGTHVAGLIVNTAISGAGTIDLARRKA